MDYEKVKTILKERVSSIKYFDKNTFEVIKRDNKKAEDVIKAGGNAQDFYKTSDTSKTRFYKENSGAYCELLSILAES